MNILGIGTFEFLLIFLVAFIVLGPNKIRKFSYSIFSLIDSAFKLHVRSQDACYQLSV